MSCWPFAAFQGRLEQNTGVFSLPWQEKSMSQARALLGRMPRPGLPSRKHFWASGPRFRALGTLPLARASATSCSITGKSRPQTALFKLQTTLSPVTSLCQGCKSFTSGTVLPFLCAHNIEPSTGPARCLPGCSVCRGGWLASSSVGKTHSVFAPERLGGTLRPPLFAFVGGEEGFCRQYCRAVGCCSRSSGSCLGRV